MFNVENQGFNLTILPSEKCYPSLDSIEIRKMFRTSVTTKMEQERGGRKQREASDDPLTEVLRAKFKRASLCATAAALSYVLFQFILFLSYLFLYLARRFSAYSAIVKS